ncbi:MAG: HEAT repeat domain-containing protein [Planctomycetes bacterium]|nr:HEAT repeat domain-containing protein [Planctomycetota bacterium]
MSYSPPPPGSTEVGKPTPEDVPKQDAHIRDLPPEVRRSFLLSMVFFPAAVGGGICLVLFIGWWTLREPKKSDQYALELRNGIAAGSKRTRWQVAREMSEHINDKEVQNPDVLNALLDIVEKPELDEEVETWSPSDMIRKAEERRVRLRWWAAYYAGPLAGLLGDPGGRGLKVLSKAAEEESRDDPQTAAGLRMYAADGLALFKNLDSIDVLIRRLSTDGDSGVRETCAYALGAIGFHHYTSGAVQGAPVEKLEAIREALRHAYLKDNDLDVTYNAAIALARIKDDTGKNALEKLLENPNPMLQGQARKALEILEGKKR